jgi:hypothetical protein
MRPIKGRNSEKRGQRKGGTLAPGKKGKQNRHRKGESESSGFCILLAVLFYRTKSQKSPPAKETHKKAAPGCQNDSSLIGAIFHTRAYNYNYHNSCQSLKELLHPLLEK